VRTGRKIETRRPVLDPCDGDLFDHIEADRAEPDRLPGLDCDDGFGEDPGQPQYLNRLAFAALAPARLQGPAQMAGRRWRRPSRQRRGLIQGGRLPLEQGEALARLENKVVMAVTALMSGDLSAGAESDGLIDEAFAQASR
jgi:hypothetical protein